MAQILVAYQCAKPTGEIIAVLPDDHQFSPLERLQANGGDKATWTRSFTLIIVADKTVDDLAYLRQPLMLAGAMKPTIHPSMLNRYYFAVPVKGVDLEYDELNAYGELSCAWAQAERFLLERI